MANEDRSGVTIPTHEYVSGRFEEHAIQHDSEREQRDLLREEMNRRLEGMNEFRAQLNNQQGTFVTRDAFELRKETVNAQIVALQNWRSNLEGRMIIISSVPMLVALVAAVISIWPL